MIEKLILPIVVGLVVGFVLLFGSDVKELLLPNYEITYQVVESKKLLGPKDIGGKEIPILEKNVSDVYVTQVNVNNTGKKAIKDTEILFDIEAASEPELFRVFYVTQPKVMFGDVGFTDFKTKLSKKLKLKEFVEGNSITVSFISSEHLNLKFVANKADVKFKAYTEEVSADEHMYVAIMSAISVLIGRLLIDLLVYLVAWYRKRVPKES